MENYLQILDEAISLEYNAAELYQVYAERFYEDGEFWTKLVDEEENHAAMLKGIKMHMKVNAEERQYLYKSYEILKNANEKLKSNIKWFREGKGDKKTAYEYALFLENSAIEIHYQNMLNKADKSELLSKLAELNGADKDHAERIEKLIKKGN